MRTPLLPPTPSPTPTTSCPTQVFVILFGVGERDQEGIYSLRALSQDGLPRETIIAFESEEDAQRYAGLLEATMEHVPNVCSIPPQELLDFCTDAGYSCRCAALSCCPCCVLSLLRPAPKPDIAATSQLPGTLCTMAAQAAGACNGCITVCILSGPLLICPVPLLLPPSTGWSRRARCSSRQTTTWA